MKTLSDIAVVSGVVRYIGLTFIALATPAFGQPGVNVPAATVHKQLIQQSADESALLFAAGNGAAAESALIRANASKPGTAEWELESARRLVEIGLLFQTNRDFRLGRQVAERAFDHLQLAETKFSAAHNSNGQASVRGQLGFIYVCFLGDMVTAQLYYAQAAQLNPRATNSAHEAERLGVIVAKMARKK